MEIGEETEDQIDPVMNLDTWPEPPPTDAVDDGEYSDMLLVGFVIVNVVGLQHYQGTISGRELVALIREELNPHDSRAIKVLNMVSMQVGYIERRAAAVLSPLIDAGCINVEGIVPKREGRGSKYKIPCQVHIFARKEEFGRVKAVLLEDGWELISENSALFTLSEAMAVKEKNGFTGVKSVDEIFKQLEMQVRKKGVLKALEPPKDLIKTKLFWHQKEGLGWLFSRENSIELPPFWVEKNGVYVNELTNFQTNKRPKPLRGGIFADDMGLGKTLTLLSLIAFDKSADSSALKRKAADPSANVKGKGPALDRLEPNTTLIVCPPSVISSWISELEEHTVKRSFKVYLYYGERTKDIEELKKHDIVLTTYSTLATEGKDTSPIKEIEWRRVILDEAHVIKNAKTNQSRTVTNLNAKRRWAITGTPMPNNTFDLFSLVNFLKFEPLSMKSLWRSLIQRPLAQGDDRGFSRLQVLMAAISLRRTKEKGLAGLPSKTIETVFVDLREDERKLYEEMEAESKLMDFWYKFDYFTNLSILVRLRQACNDLTLCPHDLRTFFLPNRLLLLTNVKKQPKLLEKLLLVLQDGEDFDCPICMNPPTDVVITCCAHIFCKTCIMTVVQPTQPSPSCPMCRHPLSKSDLFTAPLETSQTISTEGTPSSKVTALLKLLSEARDAKPSSKSVIFSQFQKMLLILEAHLKEAGFKVARLDGLMNAKRRTKVIKDFGIPAPDGPTIMLASLKACNAGINLTAASTVYLLEPWWNPAVEDQAMDRVHRIGQKEDVKVVRLLARNTVEERVLKLQEKKRMLAKNAFGGRNQKDLMKLNKDDFASLINS